MHQTRGEKNINYNKVKQHASGTFFFFAKSDRFFLAQPILIFELSLVEKKIKIGKDFMCFMKYFFN